MGLSAILFSTRGRGHKTCNRRIEYLLFTLQDHYKSMCQRMDCAHIKYDFNYNRVEKISVK